MKMTSVTLALSIALTLSSAAVAQQSNGVQANASGNASTSASASRNGAQAGGRADAAGEVTTDVSSASLAQDTELDATLSKPVDARKAKAGDEVTATANEDIKSNGQVAIKKGSKLVGRVISARPLSRGEGAASAATASELAIVFDRAVLNDGREVPLNATIQALAASESRASAGLSDASAGLGSAGAGAGSVRSGGGLVGGIAGGAAGTVGGMAGSSGGVVNSGIASSGALSKSAGAVGGLEATGRFASGSRGVFGLKNIAFSPTGEASGSALTSTTGTVRLDRGTRMLLVNGSGNAAGSAGASLSQDAIGATSQAAGSASGAAQITQRPVQNAAPARERADRR